MKQIDLLNGELNRLFDVFNEKYFNNKLEKALVIAQTNGTNRSSMGWFTVNKVWKDKKEQKDYYEITICAEYLYRNIYQICSTLIHEMVHLYCKQNGIQDVSRGNTYHNKKFKEVAERCKLRVFKTEKSGYNTDDMIETEKPYITSVVNKDVFVLTRINHGEKSVKGEPGEPESSEDGQETGEKKKSSTRRYICPSCGLIVRATKDVNIICGDCNMKFEKQE